MYPVEAKRYQKIIVDTLNQIDYEGSMIYDEYPDKWQLYRLTQIIMDKIKRMESMEQDKNERNETDKMTEKPWDQIEEFVQVLLYYEIYKKRHMNHKGILKF